MVTISASSFIRVCPALLPLDWECPRESLCVYSICNCYTAVHRVGQGFRSTNVAWLCVYLYIIYTNYTIHRCTHLSEHHKPKEYSIGFHHALPKRRWRRLLTSSPNLPSSSLTSPGDDYLYFLFIPSKWIISIYFFPKMKLLRTLQLTVLDLPYPPPLGRCRRRWPCVSLP